MRIQRPCRKLFSCDMVKRISCTVDGYDRISLLRARQSLRTRPNSYVSRYLIPPQARFDDCCEVTEAKSPLSISATFAPLAASAAAETAPLMPPPSTSASKRVSASLIRLVSRNLRYGMESKIQ